MHQLSISAVFVIAFAFVMEPSQEAVAKDSTPPPKSASAKLAIGRYEEAIRDAEVARRKALTEATRKLIDDLTSSRKEAMRSDNLPEANAIDERLRQAKAELDTLVNPEKHVQPFNIDGQYRYHESGDRAGTIIINGTTISHPITKQTTTFERQGNEIRVMWPQGWSERYVFIADGKYEMENWSKGRKPFEGKPDITGTGERIP